MMGKGQYQRAVAALREAPFDFAQWAVALDETARACGAVSAQLLSFGQCRFVPIVAPGFAEEDIGRFVALEGADPRINHGLRAVQRSSLHQIIVDAEYLPEGERARDRLYNEFFGLFDGGYIASGTVARNVAATSNINLFLSRRTGGLAAEGRQMLGRLLPRFTDALRLSTRLGVEAAMIANGAWDRLGQAALLCDGDGRLLHANGPAERLLRAGIHIRERQGRLIGEDSFVPERLADAIRIVADARSGALHSLVARSDDGAAMILDLMPLPLASDPLAGLVLILMRDPAPMVRLDQRLIQAAFGLTAAEGAVAEGVMRRQSSADIARVRGVSIETVNSQVKAVLAKTGCASRGDLTLILQRFVERTERRQ